MKDIMCNVKFVFQQIAFAKSFCLDRNQSLVKSRKRLLDSMENDWISLLVQVDPKKGDNKTVWPNSDTCVEVH